MARNNDVHQINDGKTYYSAKDVGSLSDDYERNLKDVTSKESNYGAPPTKTTPGGGGPRAKV